MIHRLHKWQLFMGLFACCALSTAGVRAARAAEVEVQLSSRETYVGAPLILQIAVTDVTDFAPPEVPAIDGCRVRAAGAPRPMTQIIISNGRRSERQSVTMRYRITPLRAGSFQVPPLELRVDGRRVETEALRFVASKSETGDLLFVEIEGKKKKVFVGQPLDLSLKIWLKPYRDKNFQVTLSEGDMWQMLSRQSSWGAFAERLQELAQNNQRPAGQSVLRDDGQGNEREYYLYEIQATIYPTRPGRISADDVQLVVDYPTALGKSRSLLDDFFEDSPFGNNSPLSRMMNDDFFGPSFGNRLSVTASRPIVGEVQLDSTIIVPVPTQGRPADYRGAVGRYQIVTHATPTTVDAGDPITLDIGIAGSGPMELVQAPPLAAMPELTADFKVTDDSLAGFVQNDSKVFSTTIRPLREGIASIPPISFSYFDPDSETFETVRSDPISITVHPADTLAFESIVGNSRRTEGDAAEGPDGGQRGEPDFTNHQASDVLISQTPPVPRPWWLLWGVVPPLLWFAAVAVRLRSWFASRLSGLRSAYGQSCRAIARAKEGRELVDAVTQYVARRTRTPCESPSRALGALRRRGWAELANEAEAFLHSVQRSGLVANFSEDNTTASDWRGKARHLIDQMEHAFQAGRRLRVRAPRGGKAKAAVRQVAPRVWGGLLAVLLAASGSYSGAEEAAAPIPAAAETSPTLTLTPSQRETLLAEAGEIYERAMRLAQSDAAEATELFGRAAAKYRLLVDSGIHNAPLYINLGNAYLQGDELGRAIASYERALQFSPHNRQATNNLQFAESLVSGEFSPSATAASTAEVGWPSVQTIMHRLWRANAAVRNVVGHSMVQWTLVLSSVLFWGLLVARTCGIPFPLWRLATVPMILLVCASASAVLTSSDPTLRCDGVLVADQVQLYAADGTQFAEVASVETAQGQRVAILASRGNWTQIRTPAGHVGWIPGDEVQRYRG
ncbi:MAG: BatD family protein [Planctomycetales bacterium]|nr:BatD family protein [Planctomycetales bacterium]